MVKLDFSSPLKATVGFDFGSTNSCAYYQIENTNANDIKPIPFANHRLSIIGFDNKAGETAEHDELLFISNEEPVNKNGQIKSWLHEHNEKFINSTNVGKDEELVGGVPVNETNIHVKSMDAYEIMTQAGRLRYNMKWLVDEVGKKRKQAFVKMVWVHICADLFEKGYYPYRLNWSYPSAMGTRDMQALKAIFRGLPEPCPSYKLEKDHILLTRSAIRDHGRIIPQALSARLKRSAIPCSRARILYFSVICPKAPDFPHPQPWRSQRVLRCGSYLKFPSHSRKLRFSDNLRKTALSA